MLFFSFTFPMLISICPEFRISTDLLQMKIEEQDGLLQAQIRATPGHATLRLPANFDFSSSYRQTWLRKVIADILRWQCRHLLTPRITAYAERGELHFNRIVYKDIRSKWGSCSSLKNLNFSVWLLLLPSHLIDYVICHELAHLNQLNHSADFWKEADRILNKAGEAKKLDKELNNFIRSSLDNKTSRF